jgi:Kef-type K+ transport system membrane component KefB
MNFSSTWTNFVQFFHNSVILSLGILLFVGYFTGKLFERLKLPAITGYIVSGLLLGEGILGVVHAEMGAGLKNITEVALGFIALTIGGEFSLSKIRRAGVKILLLTLFEALFAFIFVTTIMSVAGVRGPVAFILGAISAATAPAATVVIIRELRVRGEFIDYLYGIVAFDDAVCVILFGIIFAAVGPMLSGMTVDGGILHGLWHAMSELFFSIMLGILGGLLLHLLTIRKVKKNEIMLIALALLFIVTALATVLKLSALLANMAMGAILINLASRNHRVFEFLEPITPPIFALFFIIAGTELDVSVFAEGTVVVLGLLYLSSRFLGKMSGIFLGGTLVRAPKHIRNYLGFCLFPQAGVAIGLALFVQTSQIAKNATPEVQELFILIVNIVLFSVFINELIGPAISKFGIKKGCRLM